MSIQYQIWMNVVNIIAVQNAMKQWQWGRVALQTLDLTAWSIFKLYNLQKTADYHSAIVYTYFSSSCGFHMNAQMPILLLNLTPFSLYE